MDFAIDKLDREVSNGGVICVHWSAKKEDGDISSKTSGAMYFIPDPSAPGFVPYGQLTEKIVLSWFSNAWLSDIEAQLDLDIAKKKNPPIVSGVPWLQNEDQL